MRYFGLASLIIATIVLTVIFGGPLIASSNSSSNLCPNELAVPDTILSERIIKINKTTIKKTKYIDCNHTYYLYEVYDGVKFTPFGVEHDAECRECIDIFD